MKDENVIENEIKESESIGTFSDPNIFIMMQIPITENYCPTSDISVSFIKKNDDEYQLTVEVDNVESEITLSRIELRKIQKAIEVVLSPEFMDEA